MFLFTGGCLWWYCVNSVVFRLMNLSFVTVLRLFMIGGCVCCFSWLVCCFGVLCVCGFGGVGIAIRFGWFCLFVVVLGIGVGCCFDLVAVC